MRVALIRGPNLNNFEMQTYEPLTRMGVEVTGFTTGAPNFELPKWMTVRQLPSPHDTLRKFKGVPRRALEMAAYRRGQVTTLKGLEDALKDFDIIHPAETFNDYTAQAADAAKRHGKPLVVTVWENIPFLPLEAPYARNRDRVLREARAFIAVTERAKAALLIEGAPEDRIHVIPVGVDLTRFKPQPRNEGLRAKHGIPAGALTLLFTARLTWEKGLLDILYALKLLDAQGRNPPGPKPHLLVVGAGDQRAVAEARAREMGLADRVHFVGGIPYAETAAYYAAADVFVLGSIPTERWQEQYGMVLVEAMASGVPVITAASGSIPEVVGDAAIQVQPNDPVSFAYALEHVWDAKTREELSRRGRERAERFFDREKVAADILKLYRSLT